MKTFIISLLLTSATLLMVTKYTANYVLHGESLSKRQYSTSPSPSPTISSPVVTVESTKTITLPAKTITPDPNPKGEVIYTTYVTTTFSVVPASTEYTTTTDKNGDPIVYSTYVPPTTVAVVQSVESPISTKISGSADSSHVWKMGISMMIVVLSVFVFLA